MPIHKLHVGAQIIRGPEWRLCVKPNERNTAVDPRLQFSLSSIPRPAEIWIYTYSGVFSHYGLHGEAAACGRETGEGAVNVVS